MRIRIGDSDVCEAGHRYSAGDVVTMNDQLAQRFLDNGWAVPDGAPDLPPRPAPADVTLDVQKSFVGSTTRVRE